MPVNKKQIQRMIKLVAEMRQNNYPNSASFAKLLKRAELVDNLNIACSERTIKRDIEALKSEFQAPIVFSQENNGYYLDNPFWVFQAPTFCDGYIASSMLGARIAEDVMPEPVKTTIRDAVDNELAGNNSNFFDVTYMESLLIFSGANTDVDPKIFHTVFEGWRQRKPLKLTYGKDDADEEPKEMRFEPHIIACRNGNWYVKGVNIADKKVLILAIFRIKSVDTYGIRFDIRKDILDDTRKNGLFDYPKLSNVKVRCAKEIAFYIREQQYKKKLTIKENKDGSLDVTLGPSTEFDIVRWVLAEGGKVEVLEPENIRRRVHDEALEAAKTNEIRKCPARRK
ncbi:MAG: WYL domain-containing protein [Victivallaceae bacterium]|nr:WYL domain-containing protein [Victivallaceae bacterium]